MAPWGPVPRHTVWWASNTFLMFLTFLSVLAATVVSDIFGEPPAYLTGLLGTSAGVFFAALSSDKSKRDAEVKDTAVRAERKADEVERRVERGELRADESEKRADTSEQQREAKPPVPPVDDKDDDKGGDLS